MTALFRVHELRLVCLRSRRSFVLTLAAGADITPHSKPLRSDENSGCHRQ
jgi:hypothetical protein